MATSIVEREARFLVDDPAVHRAAARLASLGGFAVVRRRRERQRNTYLDTEDLRLRRGRAVLKLREARRSIEVTFKQSLGYRAGVASRRELTQRIPSSKKRSALRGTLAIDPIRRARDYAGAHALRPLFTLLTDRRTLILAEGRGRVELDVDRVTFRRAGRVIAKRLEIEVENLTASPAVFRKAIAALRRRFGARLRLSPVTKFEYGLRVSRSVGDGGGIRTRRSVRRG